MRDMSRRHRSRLGTPTVRADGGVYHSSRLADGYAFDRPAVHPRVMRLIAARLGLSGSGNESGKRVRRALDVGCGAGLSAAVLEGVAEEVVALDPAAPMLAHCRRVAPRTRFVVARAEALPVASGGCDLVTAAGSLNYADTGACLAEIARVLAPAGTLVIYDFSGGRRFCDAAALSSGDTLDGWFAEFERRWPFAGGYAMDVAALDYAAAGLRLVAVEPFEIALPIGPEAYLRYVLSETNVEQAIRGGADRAAIERWCADSLRPLFPGDATREVLFIGYAAYVVHLHWR